MEEYGLDVSIDASALDVEWLRQPSLSLKYGRQAATAGGEMEMARQRLDLVKADLDNKIREEPESYGVLVKVTEAVVNATILKQQDYKDAYEEYLAAKYENDVAKAAVQAIEHKKTALENLVRLYGQQYFAGPTIPRNISQEWENAEKNKMANKKVQIKRKS